MTSERARGILSGALDEAAAAERSLDRQILEAVRKEGPLSARAIENHDKVKGKRERIRAGVKRLESAGLLFRDGKGKPYSAAPEGAA